MFKTKFNPGDIAYYSLCRGFIIPVYIDTVEVPFAVENSNTYWWNKSSTSEWVYTDGIITDSEKIKNLISSRTSTGITFYWLDEFIGHSEPEDELFLTLNEAFAHTDFIDKRKTYRRHKKIEKRRMSTVNWLAKQRTKEECEGWREKLLKLNEKPVYVKKK